MNHTRQLVRTIAVNMLLGVLGLLVGVGCAAGVLCYSVLVDPLGAGRMLVRIGRYTKDVAVGGKDV